VGRLGALARALPRSQTVLLVRHPCGQIASILRGHAAGKFSHALPSEQYRVLEVLMSTDQARAHGLTLAGLRELQPVERMAWRWVLFLEKALEEGAGLAAACRVVRYEDLCAHPLEQARELFAFAGLDWHPQTERFLHDSTKSDGAEYFGVRKDPQRSASKWQDELSEEDVQRILAIIQGSPAGRLVLGDEEAQHQDAAG
ncbi:MAG TPA: sulfotransferase, partial [Thermoanaerobaculia bacterium]|nr:sulfotransferase [Thermoanaerobaculia bacterium]